MAAPLVKIGPACKDDTAITPCTHPRGTQPSAQRVARQELGTRALEQQITLAQTPCARVLGPYSKSQQQSMLPCIHCP